MPWHHAAMKKMKKRGLVADVEFGDMHMNMIGWC